AHQQVQQGVEPRPLCALEVAWADDEGTTPRVLQRCDQPVDPTACCCVEVLLQGGLCGTGVTAPQGRVHVPVQDLVPVCPIIEPATVEFQQPYRSDQGGMALQDTVVVQTQPARHRFQKQVGVGACALQGRTELPGVDLAQMFELGSAGGHRRGRPQQPVEGELVPAFLPAVDGCAHHLAGVGPLRAHLCQRQVTLGQLGAAGVDPVEDPDDFLDVLVHPGDFLL